MSEDQATAMNVRNGNEKANKRKETRELLKAEKQTKIVKKNNAHPMYGFARSLANRILSEHGFDGDVIFRNLQRSDCMQKKDGRYTIRFGYENLDYSAENGFREYSSWTWIWNGEGHMTGLKAIWAIVLHETAHTVQFEAGKIGYRDLHNNFWANAVKELRVLYPFEEVSTG